MSVAETLLLIVGAWLTLAVILAVTWALIFRHDMADLDLHDPEGMRRIERDHRLHDCRIDRQHTCRKDHR